MLSHHLLNIIHFKKDIFLRCGGKRWSITIPVAISIHHHKQQIHLTKLHSGKLPTIMSRQRLLTQHYLLPFIQRKLIRGKNSSHPIRNIYFCASLEVSPWTITTRHSILNIRIIPVGKLVLRHQLDTAFVWFRFFCCGMDWSVQFTTLTDTPH